MHVECIRNYGADADGRRGITMLEASLDDSDEEREEIAEQICEAIMEGEDIDLEKFEVVFTQDSFPYRFDVSPLDYIDLIIPLVLKKASTETLIYLEQILKIAGHKNKQLKEALYENN